MPPAITTIDVVEQQHGRDAKDAEVAVQLGVSLDEYHSMLNEAACGRVVGIEDLGVSDDVLSGEPEDDEDSNKAFSGLAKERFQQALAEGISHLPEREALVLSLYYDEEMNLKEIGQILSVSESRVSQIHSQAMHRLRARMKDWY